MARDFIISRGKMAKRLGCSLSGLNSALKEPGAPSARKPGLWSYNEVSQWWHARDTSGANSSQVRAVKLQILESALAKAKREERIAAGAVITVEKIKPVIDKFLSELTTNLQQKFEMELPQKCKGKGQIEIQQLNAEAVDFVLKQLKSGIWALGIEAA